MCQLQGHAVHVYVHLDLFLLFLFGTVSEGSDRMLGILPSDGL